MSSNRLLSSEPEEVIDSQDISLEQLSAMLFVSRGVVVDLNVDGGDAGSASAIIRSRTSAQSSWSTKRRKREENTNPPVYLELLISLRERWLVALLSVVRVGLFDLVGREETERLELMVNVRKGVSCSRRKKRGEGREGGEAGELTLSNEMSSPS